MLPELTGFCRQTVRIAPRTGLDGYGQPSFGADVAVAARVVGKRRVVRNMLGEEVLSTHTVYLARPHAVAAHDRLTLSTGDAGSTEPGALTPEILAVGRFPDDLGRAHVTLYLA